MAADLLPLALSRPNEALERARRLLADDPGPYAASLARQAIGIVLREFGDIEQAVRELRAARRLARKCRSAEREADVLATLGVALVFAGRTASGRTALNTAVGLSTGLTHGRILLRRGGVLLVLGRHRAALADLNAAISVLRVAGDLLWEARARTERAFCHLALGAPARAAADLGRAGELFAQTGQELESADATANHGVLALRVGDLPAALGHFDAAARHYDRLGTADATLSLHRCAALLTAGLPEEALAEADEAIERLLGTRGQRSKQAELMLTAAECALAAGRPAAALERAGGAARLFDRQRRRWWRAHARLVMVRAEFAAGSPTGTLLRAAGACVRDLAALSSPHLPLGHLLTGRIALALGRTRVAREHLTAAARARRGGPAQARTTGWLAHALLAQLEGDARALLHACGRGLAVIDEHRGTLGSSELRAQATAQGAELAALGQRHALRAGRPRMLLTWSERWRAGALAVPPARPPDDPDLQSDLAAIRAVAGRLADAHARGLPTALLQAEQVRLERAARARALRARGDRIACPPFDPARLLAALGGDLLLELVEVDGRLHVLLCGDGRVRRLPAGPLEQAARQLHLARFALSRLAHGRSTLAPVTLLNQLESAGAELERLLLGASGRALGGRDVVIVPPGRLHGVPWSMLPSLRERVVSVAPSAASWLRAREPGADGEGVVLVRGPGLASKGAEVPKIAAGHAGPVVLGDGTATVPRILAAMEGRRLAHIAAHGTFRADSPLFSALRVDDGPLTVYDLERLRRPPRQVVLSSCESGRGAAAGADELLGLVACLVKLGTAGVVASVVPVNDAAAVPLMVSLHRELRAGAALPAALTAARRECAGDPVAVATGWSFQSFGAG
ncbi:CHAT domain-containing protein [Nonomuraea sp. NPDC050547]|uniref:CHAT domain-containing protein n=1 Tax=unclassified Nonomuraea TaxID=2593643 RepID=UPI0037B05360